MTIFHGVISFGNAWAEYCQCWPNPMQRPVAVIDRPDTAGIDYKLGEKKPKPFEARCVIFGDDLTDVGARLAAWKEEQGTVKRLTLPDGYVPNVLLQDVSRATDVQWLLAATNRANCELGIVLTFVQTQEGE